jgi:predicted HAD superfamily Cof-like phosphohydrolase
MNPYAPYTDHERRVRQMMRAFNQNTPDTPRLPSETIRAARVRMLLEEVLEFADASAINVSVVIGKDQSRFIYSKYVPFAESGDADEGSFTLTNDPLKEPDLVEMADALGDISVVNTGAFAACGIAMTPILEAIDSNNLLKVAKGKLDAGGKFIKSPDHQPPDIAFVLRSLGWEQPT